jgi:hypothetical protein
LTNHRFVVHWINAPSHNNHDKKIVIQPVQAFHVAFRPV